MTDVLGLPLDVALLRLRERGDEVRLVEVACRKGPKGDDARVIKTERTETDVTVYWSRFSTEVK